MRSDRSLASVYEGLRLVVVASFSTLACLAVTALSAKADELIEIVQRELSPKFNNPRNYEILQKDDDAAIVGMKVTRRSEVFDDRLWIPAANENVYVYFARGMNHNWTIQDVQRSGGLRSRVVLAWSQSKEEAARTLFVSESEVDSARERIILATAPDDVAMAHLRANRTVFETIRSSIDEAPETEAHFTASHAKIGSLLSAVGIHYADRIVLSDTVSKSNGCNAHDCFTLVVVATPFYRVGYFYMRHHERVPRMSNRDYLVIRPLGDGWYFFRQR